MEILKIIYPNWLNRSKKMRFFLSLEMQENVIKLKYKKINRNTIQR